MAEEIAELVRADARVNSRAASVKLRAVRRSPSNGMPVNTLGSSHVPQNTYIPHILVAHRLSCGPLPTENI